MRSLVILLILATSLSAWANGKVYLDIEDEDIVSIFNKPGMNWKTCAKDPQCKSVGWPDNKSNIEILSAPKKMNVEDPYTGEIVEEQYFQVKYSYERTVDGKVYKQEGTGWLDASYVSQEKRNSFYGVAQDTRKKNGPDCDPVNGKKGTPQALAPLAKTLSHKTVTEAADMLKPLVGSCVIDPRESKAHFVPGNPYDTYALPAIQRKAVPKIQKGNGQMMTMQDLIDIDALSRTLYAEMARCYKNGLHYPMTVAKIAWNRAQATGRKAEFIKAPQDSSKGNLAKVVTTPSQFSLWLTKIDGKSNGTLRQALCPPTQGNKAFWTGGIPSKSELDIWENTLRIATETVLYPDQFSNRTKSVRQFHYTSGMNGFYKMKQVFPWIEDRKVSKNSCVQVWDEGPRP